MIFSSINEDGIPAWRLVLEEKKTVTRRLKPQPIGSIRAVQPNRCKRAVCHILILTCEPSSQIYGTYGLWNRFDEIEQQEAKLEGFNSWEGLLSYFKSKRIDINKTHRIEFKKVI